MRGKSGEKKLAFLIFLYTVCFSILTLERHQRMESNIFDLGIFDQALYLLSQGEGLFLTTRGLHVHADHFHPILYLVAPLYLIWPSVKGLLVFQSLVIGLGAYPAYQLGRHYGFQERWSLLVAGAYLAHPAIGFLNRFDFHPVAFVAPILMFAVLFLEQSRPGAYAIAVVAALCCTEAMGFTILALAVTAFWIRGRWWFLGTFSLGVAGILTAKSWLKYFSPNKGSPYAMLYTEYGNGELEVVLTILTQPLDTISSLAIPVNFEYLFYLFGPLLFLPLLAPDRLLPAVPVLLGNLLSWRYSQHRIEYHYGAALAPILIWAAVVGWDRIRRKGLSTQLMGRALLAVTLLTAVLGPISWKHLSRMNERADLSQAVTQIREDETVTACNSLGSYFTGRKEVFCFPNPIFSAAWDNVPQALIEQASTENGPISRGRVRRGLESTDVDCIVLPLTRGRRTNFPMAAAENWVVRDEVGRARCFEPVEPIEGDAFVLRRRVAR
jgi:uncharacterized membrane protein